MTRIFKVQPALWLALSGCESSSWKFYLPDLFNLSTFDTGTRFRTDSATGDDDDDDDDVTGDDDDVTGDDDDDSTTDTAFRSDIFVPDYFGVSLGNFALDHNSPQFVSARLRVGASLPLRLVISLYAASAFVDGVVDETNSCTLVLTHPGPVAPTPIAGTWVGNSGLLGGLTMPADSVVESQCDNIDDPAYRNLARDIHNFTWGVGVGLMTPAIDGQLEDAYGSGWTVNRPYAGQGGWYSSLLEGSGFATDGYLNLGYTLGMVTNEANVLQEDGSGDAVLLSAPELADGARLAEAYFEVRPVELIGPASLLVQ